MHITFLSYNIRHCRGTSGRVSIPAVAGSITDAGVNVAGLQEVDRYNPRSCFNDQARKLGMMTGMSAVMGVNLRFMGFIGFGNAVLSRYPVIDVYNYSLPHKGEKRGLLRTELCVGKQNIVFYNTHLGLDQDERRCQVDTILTITAGEKLPLVLVGDFNALPQSPEIKELKNTFILCDPFGVRPTFPSLSPQHKIDYVFFSSHWRVIECMVYYSEASDHLPLAVKLYLDGEQMSNRF